MFVNYNVKKLSFQENFVKETWQKRGKHYNTSLTPFHCLTLLATVSISRVFVPEGPKLFWVQINHECRKKLPNKDFTGKLAIMFLVFHIFICQILAQVQCTKLEMFILGEKLNYIQAAQAHNRSLILRSVTFAIRICTNHFILKAACIESFSSFLIWAQLNWK